LNVGVRDLDERLLNPIAVDQLAVIYLSSEGSFVVLDCRFQIGDSDRDVIDLGQLHIVLSVRFDGKRRSLVTCSRG
jgi:hypothetical protein